MLKLANLLHVYTCTFIGDSSHNVGKRKVIYAAVESNSAARSRLSNSMESYIHVLFCKVVTIGKYTTYIQAR